MCDDRIAKLATRHGLRANSKYLDLPVFDCEMVFADCIPRTYRICRRFDHHVNVANCISMAPGRMIKVWGGNYRWSRDACCHFGLSLSNCARNSPVNDHTNSIRKTFPASKTVTAIKHIQSKSNYFNSSRQYVVEMKHIQIYYGVQRCVIAPASGGYPPDSPDASRICGELQRRTSS